MTGAFAIFPVSVLLALSFVVVYLMQKTKGVIRLFGAIVAILLWISAALATYTAVSGTCPIMKKMGRMCKYGKYKGMKSHQMMGK